MDETPKTTKHSVKEVSKEVQLVTACVSPRGRSEKSTTTLSSKQSCNIEMSLRKGEQELDKTEKKYHEATKEVEVARQDCDAEMCRSCDQMQTMELDRINEMEKFIQTYTNAIQILCETMNQVKQDLQSVRVTPQEDIVTVAKLNIQATETEILLYDIYAENEHNAMSQERRVLSLMHWIQMLKQDIDIQRRSKDGIENLQGFCKQNQKFSTGLNSGDITMNRERVRLLQCLYEGSLYKMEKMYSQLKHLSEPQYEHSQRFAKSYTEKGTPTSFLRIPFQPLIQAPPSAPSSTSYLAQATPVLSARPMMQQSTPAPQPQPPPPYSAHQSARIGWTVEDTPNERSTVDRSPASTPPYPVLPHEMTTSTDSLRYHPAPRHVRVLHAYEAQHDDELTMRPGDIIILIERRSDQWCKGNLNGRVGLFPGNFVQDV